MAENLREEIEQGLEGFSKVGANIDAGLHYRAEHPAGGIKVAGAMLFFGGIACAIIKGEIIEGASMAMAGVGLYKVAEPMERIMRPDIYLDDRGEN
jgi:hypothetical protein